MDSTTLNLLTRDGAVAMTFTPALTPQQYSELHDLALAADTELELTQIVRSAAARWGTEVIIDPPLAVNAGCSRNSSGRQSLQ